MVQTNEKAIIITGGPGMGKTSIIEQMEKMGYSIIPESGRVIIRSQLISGGDRLPWEDRKGFAMEMFYKAIDDYKQAFATDTCYFFDRGIPDVIGYLALCKLSIPEKVYLAAKQFRYCQKVFITPPWQEIYINDNERKQSFEEAKFTYEAMVKVYTGLHYNLIEVPKITIEERAKFIEGFVKN